MTLKERVKKRLPWRREPPNAGPFTLRPGRIYILPTREGLFFAFGVVMLFLGSMNYAVSLGFALTFLLAATGVVSAFYAQNNLKNLNFSIYNAQPVFAGEASRYDVTLNNADQTRGVSVEFARQDSKKSHIDSISVNYGARGGYTLGLVKIQSRFPLGLFRSWAYVNSTQTAVVYPNPAPPTPFLSDPQGNQEGEVPFKSRTGVDDFSGLKDYAGGDSLRRIHWKAYARSGVLLVKEFDQLGGARLGFDFDDLKGMDDEARLAVLCRWILDAHKTHEPFTLILPGQKIGPGVGISHRARCLEALALWKP